MRYCTLLDILESTTKAIREYGTQQKVGIFTSDGDLIKASDGARIGPHIEMGKSPDEEYIEFI